MDPDECKQVLLTGTEKIDPILNPLGFRFEISGVGVSSGGPFASGLYAKGDKLIGLIYRSGIGLGAVIYEYHQSSILHDDLMKYLGKYDVNKLKYSSSRLVSLAKERGDPFEALAYDIQNFALGFLNSNDTEFENVLQEISVSTKAKADQKQFTRQGSLQYGKIQ